MRRQTRGAASPYSPPRDILVPIHAPLPRRHPILKTLALMLLGAVVTCASAIGFAWQDLQGNITNLNADPLLKVDGDEPKPDEPERPTDIAAGRALNILIIGSDSRDGANDVDLAGATGHAEGARSDTTMIAHISADRSHVDIVSIPRDTLVMRPACAWPDGRIIPAQPQAMFNSAFAVGAESGDLAAAAACTIRTIEELTNLIIDDFVIVDFSGLKDITDALGGVKICVDQAINDRFSGLKLEPGCHILDGTQGLAWTRARKSLGDGSDIGRIGRQQQFIASIVDDVLSRNILTNVPQLYAFLDATTRSLTTGSKLSNIQTLGGVGYSLRGLRRSDITMLTMPWLPAGNRVVPHPLADTVWQALANDMRLVDVMPAGTVTSADNDDAPQVNWSEYPASSANTAVINPSWEENDGNNTDR